MKNYSLSILATVVFVMSSFISPVNEFTLQVKGTVIAADTKQPVANAYLYIVKGEEEILTNAKGEFILTTAEKLPFTVTVIHKDYKQYKLTVNNASQQLKVELQKK